MRPMFPTTNLFSQLSEDVITEILKYLNPLELIQSVELLNKQFCYAFSRNNNELWSSLAYHLSREYLTTEEVEEHVNTHQISYRDFVFDSGVLEVKQLQECLEKSSCHAVYSFHTQPGLPSSTRKRVLYHMDRDGVYCDADRVSNCFVNRIQGTISVSAFDQDAFESKEEHVAYLIKKTLLLPVKKAFSEKYEQGFSIPLIQGVPLYAKFLNDVIPYLNLFSSQAVVNRLWGAAVQYLTKNDYKTLATATTPVNDDVLLGMHLLALDNSNYREHFGDYNIPFIQLLQRRLQSQQERDKCWDTYLTLMKKGSSEYGPPYEMPYAFKNHEQREAFALMLYEMAKDTTIQKMINSKSSSTTTTSTTTLSSSSSVDYQELLKQYAKQLEIFANAKQGEECSVVMDLFLHLHLLHPHNFEWDSKVLYNSSAIHHDLNLSSLPNHNFYITLDSDPTRVLTVVAHPTYKNMYTVKFETKKTGVSQTQVWSCFVKDKLTKMLTPLSHPGMVLDIDRADTSEGATLVLWKAVDTANQQWLRSSAYLRSVLNNKCLFTNEKGDVFMSSNMGSFRYLPANYYDVFKLV